MFIFGVSFERSSLRLHVSRLELPRHTRALKPPAAHAAQWHWPSGQCSDQCHARARASQTRAGAASLGRVDLEQVRCHRGLSEQNAAEL